MLSTRIRIRVDAFLACGRARRAAFLAHREDLYADIAANQAAVDAQDDHPLYLALAEHCEFAPWRDRVIIGWADLRDALRDARREQRRGDASTTITTSVRNTTGAWEIIDREPGTAADLALAEVSAEDIGGDVGQELFVQLRDEHDVVLDSTEIKAS